MARDHDRHRILPARCTNRSRRRIDAGGQFAVRLRVSSRDFAHRLPHIHLMFAAGKLQRQIKLERWIIQIRHQLHAGQMRDRVGSGRFCNDVHRQEMHMQQMQEHMKEMQAQMEKMRQTTDPAERERLIQAHMQAMQEHMKTMQERMKSMHGAGGGMMMGADQKGRQEITEKRLDMIEKRMDLMQMMMEQMGRHRGGGPAKRR